ncbi:RagB/SusD family nutrient uptake outer membrane protein [Chitinophaga arvensicola]|uniref:SusD family protein n=1 Tax=Chitinophaga arvensicola TaxID=29529 RepID=A0A1I0NK35_9BACT|nr:RagB/SusD family nutrient uptake outer membrane protein [Chitinophaga arvensicola]SEW01659.1 SusD family protein [Chitinophaga arvensicola]
MKNYLFILIFFSAVSFTACNKYLDVKPKGLVIPEKLADYESMLNSPTMVQTFPINLLDFTDDVFIATDAASQSPSNNGYCWKRVLTVDEKASPDVWGPIYRCIYDANVIINGVPAAPDGTKEEKDKVIAEAKVIRANNYLELLTVFAKAYYPATAATDPGMPMVTSTNVTDAAPARSSLKATLDAIIADVKAAIEVLPASNLNRYRLTKYAAAGLLSRIYLYMGDFPNAAIYTDKALEATHTLLDYNSYASSYDVPVYDLNPEVLWQRASTGTPIFMVYSEDLNTYFNSSDLRYSFLAISFGNGKIIRLSFPGEYSFGISFPEMYLTKAELLARNNHPNEAMDIVNMIRKKRIITDDYADQTATSAEDALAKVFAERRRELAFSGLRWFDMKRLDREGRMPEVQRINKETNKVEARLASHSPNYTFEIPVRVQMFNPGMELNHK